VRARFISGPAFARVVPFAVFMLFVAVQPLVEARLDARWLVAVRGVAAAALLALFWRGYVELRSAPRAAWWDWPLAIVAGWWVFAVWIALDSGWARAGAIAPGFDPRRGDGSLVWGLGALRVFGIALVVPVMEELFWRSFLMRRIDARDFLARDPRAVTVVAFGLSCALFASEHAQWLAGLIAGGVYGALYLRSRNLWIPIVSHATTNGTLALWILATGNWQLW
jgi:CAAX prenyl protease-like protein